MGAMGFLTDVTTMLQTAEALHPIVAAQRKAKKDTKGWDRLPPTPQRVILAASATNGTSIPTSPLPTFHCFLTAKNTMTFQEDCDMTYSWNNLYLPTSF